MIVEHSHYLQNPNAPTPPPKIEVVATVAGAPPMPEGAEAMTMFCAPGQPMLVPVSAEELEQRRDRRAPRP